MNHKVKQIALLLMLSLLPGSGLQALEFSAGNRFSGIADTLFDMMDAFSSSYQRHRNGGYDNPPVISAPFTPYYSPPPAEYVLTGRWQGQSGAIMIIRQGLFRIFHSGNKFRDGRIMITDATHFELIDPQTGSVRYYEFAESQGRLILRNPSGSILLFRRIRR